MLTSKTIKARDSLSVIFLKVHSMLTGRKMHVKHMESKPIELQLFLGHSFIF